MFLNTTLSSDLKQDSHLSSLSLGFFTRFPVLIKVHYRAQLPKKTSLQRYTFNKRLFVHHALVAFLQYRENTF